MGLLVVRRNVVLGQPGHHLTAPLDMCKGNQIIYLKKITLVFNGMYTNIAKRKKTEILWYFNSKTRKVKIFSYYGM